MRHRLLALTMIAGIALDLSGALDLSDANAQERVRPLAATGPGSVLVTDSQDDQRLVVRTRGEVRVSDDGRRVVGLEPDGYMILEEDDGRESRRLEVRATADGMLRTSWFVDGEQRPAGPEADAWLAEALPRAEELLTRYADHRLLAEDLRGMELEVREALRESERLRSAELRTALEDGERALRAARIEQERALGQARRDVRRELEAARRGWEDAHSLELELRESVAEALSDALRELERVQEIRELEFGPELEESLELLRRQLEELEVQLDLTGFGRVYHL